MYDFNEVLERLAALQRQAVDGSDASTEWLHTQETYPYWINRGAGFTVEPLADDIVIDRHSVVMRLIVGHIKAGYEGENQHYTYEQLPLILKTFSQARDLHSEEYPSPCRWLFEGEGGAEITGSASGFFPFPTATEGSLDVGMEFSITIPLLRQV